MGLNHRCSDCHCLATNWLDFVSSEISHVLTVMAQGLSQFRDTTCTNSNGTRVVSSEIPHVLTVMAQGLSQFRDITCTNSDGTRVKTCEYKSGIDDFISW